MRGASRCSSARSRPAERGGDKAAWIEDMGDKLARRFPKVRAVVWFHANKETDWRVNSSAASLSAFRLDPRRANTTIRCAAE